MAYFGILPSTVFQAGSKDSFDGDGSTTAFTLSKAVTLATDIEVFVGNVRQEPDVAYTVSGVTLTFTGTPASGTGNIYAVHKATSHGTLVPPTGRAENLSTLVTTGTITSGGTVAVTGNVTTTGTVEPAGDTAAGDNAAIGYTAAEGLILTGQGSTNDVTIKNDADADVIEIPTGTTNVTVAGTLGTGGLITSGAGITGAGLLTTGGNIVIPDAGNIGSASDTDAMAISSGGVVTFSQTPIGDFNSHYWVGTKAANQTIARVTLTTITGMTDNEKDSHTAFDGTTFTVPSGGAGLYYIFGTIYYDWGAVGNDGEDQQTLIVHTPSGGSAATIATGRHNTGATRPLHDVTQTAVVVFQLGVGDTVIMRGYGADNNGGGGGIALADQTNFGGFKIAGV